MDNNQTNKLIWAASFEVKNNKINEQHKKLFELVKNLSDACSKGESKNILGKALTFLTQYVVEHFGYEEQLMAKHHLPGRTDHKERHTEFKEIATELNNEYNTYGATENLGYALNNIVSNWLVSHILSEDVRTFAHLE
jgi:hemerythrin-like metal-binding protein